MTDRPLLPVLALLAVTSAIGSAQTKARVDGITNFSRVDATIACGGATKASAVPELKSMGFATIVNLRHADEDGADVDGEKAAAEAAGIRYVHLPFRTPTTAAENVDGTVQRFLEVVGDQKNAPVFIHCGGGGRAAAMWLIKRVRLDGWDIDRAKKEAYLIASSEPAGAGSAPRPNAAVDWAVAWVGSR